MTKAALCVAMVAVAAQIVVPIGIVPFNLSVLAVLLAGGLLKPAYAFFAMIVYLLLGICGLPIFAGFQAGIGAIVGPTGGYLISFPFMAVVVSKMINSSKFALQIKLIIGILLAIIICHVMGFLWLAYSREISIWSAFVAGSLIFIPFDLLKGALAYLIIRKIKKFA